MTLPKKPRSALRTTVADVTEGFFAITHNSFAILGLGLAFSAIALTTQPELRANTEEQLHQWLQARKDAATPTEVAEPEVASITPDLSAVERTTVANPKSLSREQAAVAYWLSKKYRVAPEPLAAMVNEAYEQGRQHKLDPTLILAVVAIESRFNPYAQSHMGAQGLMQVMTRVHTEKYDHFGGSLAAFDPVSNIRVGVSILKEYIRRSGSIEGGLKYYVGAANLPTDGGYAAKVLAEHQRIRQVAGRAAPAKKPALQAKAPAIVPAVKQADDTQTAGLQNAASSL